MTGETEKLLAAIEPRAGPLIITVFGDIIAPRGGAVWLSSLIDLMRPFGLSERLVRTGVYRLTREGWLENSARGRKSVYAITADGMTSFAEADARIYSASGRQWSGEWQIVHALSAMPTDGLQSLRKNLVWQGFGQLSRTSFIRPAGKDVTIPPHLSATTAVFTGKLTTGPQLHTIASMAWDLNAFAKSYEQLASHFSGFEDAAPASCEQAFVIRTILLHQYRSILLKDPQLPQSVLPPGWPGETARALTARLYRQLSKATERHIETHLRCPGPATPRPTPAYYERFTR
ncbi:MAG TPA: phenylacetic acid degradation operon negative regulatory protein PaaX [Rhizobiales bacterium]|nr:phenylacetic acid degradation operon negative regulatory protein PaaX [Hyphomicrobiales bacterium]